MTYAEMFREIAQKYALDWRILAEQAWTESRMNPLEVGQSNDMGLLQIIPIIWREWAPRIGVVDPFDPYSNVLVGAAYLAFLKDSMTDLGVKEFYWVLLAYNWGPGNVRRLFESQGHWLDVPASRRDYAVSIVLRADLLSVHRTAATHANTDIGANTDITLADLLNSPIPIRATTPPSVRRRDR